MKTYVPKKDEICRDWWVVDAAGLTLGRMATEVASRLRGKHKAMYTPYLDTGDHVIVVNAEQVRMTGSKLDDKTYKHYSGYAGGLKQTTVNETLATHPTRVVESAVRGMLPKGPLGRQMFRKLKIYVGPDHPHRAQMPKPLEVAQARRAG